jgi:hypothetical protein
MRTHELNARVSKDTQASVKALGKAAKQPDAAVFGLCIELAIRSGSEMPELTPSASLVQALPLVWGSTYKALEKYYATYTGGDSIINGRLILAGLPLLKADAGPLMRLGKVPPANKNLKLQIPAEVLERYSDEEIRGLLTKTTKYVAAKGDVVTKQKSLKVDAYDIPRLASLVGGDASRIGELLMQYVEGEDEVVELMTYEATGNWGGLAYVWHGLNGTSLGGQIDAFPVKEEQLALATKLASEVTGVEVAPKNLKLIPKGVVGNCYKFMWGNMPVDIDVKCKVVTQALREALGDFFSGKK